MQCDCGGILVEGKSCYTASKDDFCLILEDIPAYKCTRCGKVLFDEKTVDQIEALVKVIERRSNEITGEAPSIHSYDY